MSYLIFVLSFFVLIIHYCVTDWHQDDYDIVHDRLVVEDYNKSHVKDFKASVFKYNETLVMKAINVSGTPLYDILDNVFVHFKLFKFVSEEYRVFPFNISFDVCQEYKSLVAGDRNPFGLRAVLEKTNFKGCPFKRNTNYYVRDVALEQEKFPPHAPGGKYCLKINCHVGDIYLLNLTWYGDLVTKRGKKKKKRKG